METEHLKEEEEGEEAVRPVMEDPMSSSSAKGRDKVGEGHRRGREWARLWVKKMTPTFATLHIDRLNSSVLLFLYTLLFQERTCSHEHTDASIHGYVPRIGEHAGPMWDSKAHHNAA